MSDLYWFGPVPSDCDTCDTQITRVFYDMRTSMGPWACMCQTCATLGPGIGLTGPGRGQKYEKQYDGRWLKTEG